MAFLAGLVLSVGVSLGAQAATTWTVCASGCDYSSIKEAIAASTTMDGDTLAIAAGTYTEAGITVTKSLTLQGEDATTTIVQAAATRDAATDRVFLIPSGVTVTLQDLTVLYGRATNFPLRPDLLFGIGGGLYNAGTLTLTHSTVSGNSAAAGGGLANAGTLTLTHSIVSSNNGGGLYNLCGSCFYVKGTAPAFMTVRNSTVSDNSGRGGLYNSYYNTLTLINSTVSGNSAYSGAGIQNYGTLTVMNSTISGNSASLGSPGIGGGLGGGIDNQPNGRLTLMQSTVSGNSAAAGGGLYSSRNAVARLTSSIIAKNPHGGDCIVYSTPSMGYNLDSDRSCRLYASHADRPGKDPRLVPLQDNGGPTFTHALLPGSPALDAIPWGTNGCGTTHLADQRGQTRPEAVGGACDIGAYEGEVTGETLGGWVTGFTPSTVVCQNVTTGQVVTLSNPVAPWDCEAAGLGVTSGDRVTMHVRGPVEQGATDVGGAVAGMGPTSGGCSNRTTGQQVTFQHMQGATAASCVAAGLVVHPRDQVQMRVQGAAE